MKFRPKLQNKPIVIGHCPLAMKQNITKQLCMCVAVYELLTALLFVGVGTAREGNSETCAFGAVSI